MLKYYKNIESSQSERKIFWERLFSMEWK